MDNYREILKNIFDNLTGDYKTDIYYLNKQASNYQDHPESNIIINEIAQKVNGLVQESKKIEYTDRIYQQYINHEITKEEVDQLINAGKIDLNYYISKIDEKIDQLKEKKKSNTLMSKIEKKIAEIEIQAKLSNIKHQLDSREKVVKTENGDLSYDDVSRLSNVIDNKLNEIAEINALISRINNMIVNLTEGGKIKNKDSELKQLHNDIETKLKHLQNI